LNSVTVFSAAGYSVTVRNDGGAANSRMAPLTVRLPINLNPTTSNPTNVESTSRVGCPLDGPEDL